MSEGPRGAERAALAERLAEARADLEAFHVSVSHDLRSPIGAIVNLAALLLQTQGGRLDDEGRELLERIECAARRALARMDGLLSLSRVSRRTLAPEPVDVGAEVLRIFERVGRHRGEGPVEFDLQPLPRVTTDPELLRAVLEPLLDNAIKFSATQAKPRIEVGLLAADDPAGTAYFVRDNGVGFDPLLADRLFRPFERLHRPGEFDGAGVGLAVAARAIRRLGGRIWAESAPGRGATFFFTVKRDGDDDERPGTGKG